MAGQIALAAVALVLLFGACSAMGGCAAVKPACSVINALDDICAVIAVPAPDGGLEQVPVSGAELRAFARERQEAHARAAARDGGVP